MFRRKLCALEYQKSESFDHDNENEFRNLMLWLEDQKIRHYKIEDRAGLRNPNGSDWSKALQNYMEELGCPYQLAERSLLIDWMLGYAIRLEYGDAADQYKTVTPASIVKIAAKPAGSTNPLDNLDFNDADFKAGVASLSMILKIPPHADHLEQLKAISLLVKGRLSKEALEKSTSQSKGVQVPLEKTELGFETGDYIINEAAKIVRLLHIKDLRDLQTQINSAIVGVQTLTANPKTDSRLGKVGRM